MKIIVTKYLGPTNFRGSRIKATTGNHSVTIPYDHSLDREEVRKKAALALCKKLGWEGDLTVSGLPGGSTVFIFTNGK